MTRRVIPFLAAMTWLGLAGPSRALESPKPLYVRTLESIPASSLEAVRSREYKFLIDPAKTKASPEAAFEEIWRLLKTAASREGFELAGAPRPLALESSTKEYFDTPDQKLWQKGYLIRVTRGAKNEKKGTAVLTVKSIGEDAAAALAAPLAVRGGAKAKTEAEENVGVGPGSALHGYVEKGSSVTVPAESVASSTVGDFGAFVPELLRLGLPPETKLVGRRLYAVRARPGAVGLPGVEPCRVSMEAWSAAPGGEVTLLDVSYGYSDVDFRAASATHAAGERFFMRVFQQGLSSLAAAGDERWVGSKVRKLMNRPVDAPAAAGEAGRATTVVLLRHAEKISKGRYTSLTSTGRRRAAALATELAARKPAALFSSDLTRSQETLRPLAEATGLPLRAWPYGDERALADEILEEHRGETVVVCAHSGTLAQIASSLGWTGDFPGVIGFDRIWTLTIPPSGEPVTLVEARQGFVP
jgi:phosphohistidine phosphatase SixA